MLSISSEHLQNVRMYQRTLLSSNVLRPFASASHGITRSLVSFPTKPNTLHVVRQSSQSPIARQFSSNHAMITTVTGKVIPSTGNSRLDAKLQGGYRIIREDMTCAEFHDSVWGFVVSIYFPNSKKTKLIGGYRSIAAWRATMLRGTAFWSNFKAASRKISRMSNARTSCYSMIYTSLTTNLFSKS